MAKANLTAQQAAVQRLEELASFEKIVAPFDGVVTQRNVDVGDLVTANGTSGKPLFQVSDIYRVRIYVDVPQAFLGGMKTGVKATLTLPGKTDTFGAVVSSTSNALGESSRTALVELQADNADDKLWPGAFAEVSFHIPTQPGTLVVPATALMFGRSGMQVAAVGKDPRRYAAPGHRRSQPRHRHRGREGPSQRRRADRQSAGDHGLGRDGADGRERLIPRPRPDRGAAPGSRRRGELLDGRHHFPAGRPQGCRQPCRLVSALRGLRLAA